MREETESKNTGKLPTIFFFFVVYNKYILDCVFLNQFLFIYLFSRLKSQWLICQKTILTWNKSWQISIFDLEFVEYLAGYFGHRSMFLEFLWNICMSQRIDLLHLLYLLYQERSRGGNWEEYVDLAFEYLITVFPHFGRKYISDFLYVRENRLKLFLISGENCLKSSSISTIIFLILFLLFEKIPLKRYLVLWNFVPCSSVLCDL